MRTTITLTPEAEDVIRKVMRERGVSFKDAVNEGIVRGLTAGQQRDPISTPTFDVGRSKVALQQALRLVGDLEDEELLRKTAMGK